MERIFVLGTGAQKAGTTWLHHYLSQQSFSDFGFRKEYHVFDADEGVELGFYRRARKSAIAALSRDNPGEKGANAIRRMDFILNKDSYFDYFSSRFLSSNVYLTGDITPSYALVGADKYSMIDDEFARRNIRVRPIFLMRDPVYRLQSMVRMNLRGSSSKPTKEQEIAKMKRFFRRPGAIGRGSYPETLRNLFSAFGRDRVFVNLYETMFSDNLQHELSKFLGLKLEAPPLGEEKNVSKTDNSLTLDEYEHFRSMMPEVYNGVAELTGLDVDSHWRFRP